MARDIKLICIDMDGTLLDDQGNIPDENVRALNEAARRGIGVCINTGRMVEDVLDYVRRYDLHCMVAGCNGARIVDHKGSLIAQFDIGAADALALCDILVPTGLRLNAFFDGFVVTLADEIPWAYQLVKRGIIQCRLGKDALYGAARNGMIKIVAMGSLHDPRLKKAQAQIRRSLAHLDITSSYPDNIEVGASGSGKGAALNILCEKMGITPQQVMAIGDEANDLSMLNLAGYSVAMGNASPEVKRTCKFVTGTNVACGVAAAVRRWALNEQED